MVGTKRVSGNHVPRQPRKSGEIGSELWHGDFVFDIAHEVSLADPSAHLLEVKMTIRAASDGPLPSPLTLSMPVWTPGSYLVREFARHVEGFSASSDGAPLEHRKVKKN